MTDKSDILPNKRGWRRLSYTCRAGWVDWGHALPGSANSLKKQIDNERTNLSLLANVKIDWAGTPAYIVVYGQAMGNKQIRVSTDRHYIVKKGLSADEKQKVALGIFKDASHTFEAMQGQGLFGYVTGHSSYSPEDLVSNFIGFVRAYRGISEEKMRTLLGEVSVDESMRLWEEHLPDGFKGLKNKTMKPILFPSKECDASGSSLGMPAIFDTFSISPPGKSWMKPNQRFVDGRLINSGRPIQISAHGKIGIKVNN